MGGAPDRSDGASRSARMCQTSGEVAARLEVASRNLAMASPRRPSSDGYTSPSTCPRALPLACRSATRAALASPA